MDDNMLFLIGSASGTTKVLIDIIRAIAPDTMDGWLPPAIAVPVGIAFVLLFQIYAGDAITGQMIAGAIIAGTITGGLAVGITATQNWSQERVREAREDNGDSPNGSGRGGAVIVDSETAEP